MQDWSFECHLWAYFEESHTKQEIQGGGNLGLLYLEIYGQYIYRVNRE